MTLPIQRQRPSTKSRPALSRSRSAFTLIEVLTVVVIISILVALSAPIITSINGANTVTRNAYTLTDTLDQARSYATANNTYTWVGIFEENADAPGTPGIGRIILGIFASTDGSKIYADGTPSPGPLDPTRLKQIGELIQLEHTDLVTLSSSDIQRDTVPAAIHQVAEDTFTSPITITPPHHTDPATASYTFAKLIQFSPLGDASKIASSPVRCIEFGLRPTKGNITDTTSKNLVAVQLSGIGGQPSLHRPQPSQP
ncbi:prepilin-type N-terminal cleavage/methylation domain-containing protein [Phragmitibacter flavus]|uniref:Prepilin-type N-terminal cleavage/methylation domain-containing protein n=1 Tax=Phragmitibacter flavus TaxID=2576071 RepID=A0A5R8K8J6_9BACT|nr:type II secretion system protein [Phragmitibacter flavus]TLD68621.1 prepilin-type N-terminal cleavage/methylation domain-containing protein [Phragmitibacter flavus]